MAYRRSLYLLAALVALALVPLLPPGLSLAAPALEKAAVAYAEGRFQDVVKLIPGAERDLPEAKLLRARALLELERYGEAHAALQGLTLKLPLLKDMLRFLEAQALEGQKKYLAAARRYRDAARSKNSRWVDESWRRRADVLRQAGKHKLAVKEYQHLLRIYPEHPNRSDLELSLARCMYQAGLRRKAIGRAREIIYRWPNSEAAVRVREIISRWLNETGFQLPDQPFDRDLRLIRSLRWGKRYDIALREIERLRKTRLKPFRRVVLDLEVMRTEYKRDRPGEVLKVFKERFADRVPSRTVRRLVADALARLGRVDDAVEVLAGRLPTSLGMTQEWKARPDEGRITRLLMEHGRYKDVMKRVRKLVEKLPRRGNWRKRYLLGRYWVAYRAGEYDLAIKGLRWLAKRKPGLRSFSLYWQARAHAKAGRTKEAIALYQQVVEKYLRTYYGIQARSRLVELGKVKLSSTTCVTPVPAASQPVLSNVPELLSALIKRHGALYPSLHRARLLWKLGLLQAARRELRLVAIDFAWIKARLRPKWYILRPEVERIWRGSQPPKRRRWTKHAREVYKNRATIGPALGEILSKAGIFFYGWRFSPPLADPARHYHPRAYLHIVPRIAEQFKLDPNLLWAVMKTESAFRSDAFSRAGAIGLMQIMPHTGRRLAGEMRQKGFYTRLLFEPRVNLTMSSWYLRAVSNKFKGQLMLVAAAYNGGPHNVARWLDQRGRVCDRDEFIEEIPFAQSRRYAKKILRLVALYERVYCSKDDRVTTNTLELRYSEHPDY
jgi:soluble lytic murein transglycosylase